jgi:hypothetical protein
VPLFPRDPSFDAPPARMPGLGPLRVLLIGAGAGTVLLMVSVFILPGLQLIAAPFVCGERAAHVVYWTSHGTRNSTNVHAEVWCVAANGDGERAGGRNALVLWGMLVAGTTLLTTLYALGTREKRIELSGASDA